MKKSPTHLKLENLKRVPDGFCTWVKIYQKVNTYTAGRVVTLLSENNPDDAIEIFYAEQSPDMPSWFTEWFEKLHKNKHSDEYIQVGSLLELQNFAAIKALFHKSIHGDAPENNSD